MDGRIVCLDGATGSNLQKRGMPAGVCPEQWVLEHRDVLIGLQREFIQAGSNIVYAPTFSGNRIKLAEYGLADQLQEMNRELVAVSREAADGRALVAGDLTMTGAQLEPLGDLTFEELVDVYKEQIAAIVDGGADLLVVETMMSLQETRAALLAAKEVCPDFPVIVTMSFTESGNTLYGASAESAVVTLQALGADAVGLNCSAGPDRMLSTVKRMYAAAQIPLIAKPNAGLPQVDGDGQTYYDMDADTFADGMVRVVEAGAQLIGGCCGTAPEFIAKMKEKTGSLAPVSCGAGNVLYLADQRQVYPFEPGQTLKLGEGIDYTKDAELLEEYGEDLFDTAQDLAFDLQDEEADALLFTAAGLDGEADILLDAVTEVTQTVRMPAVIATADPHAAARVLAGYAGVAGVMPLCTDGAGLAAMEQVIKHYGAYMVTIDKKIRCC